MIVYLKANDLELDCELSPIEFCAVMEMSERGCLSAKIAVTRGERVGFIPMDDVDAKRTLDALQVLPNQLPLEL